MTTPATLSSTWQPSAAISSQYGHVYLKALKYGSLEDIVLQSAMVLLLPISTFCMPDPQSISVVASRVAKPQILMLWTPGFLKQAPDSVVIAVHSEDVGVL